MIRFDVFVVVIIPSVTDKNEILYSCESRLFILSSYYVRVNNHMCLTPSATYNHEHSQSHTCVLTDSVVIKMSG